MKNKKGFTLVELLAVIVVLAIILTIAVGSVTNAINKTKERAKYAAAKEIVAIAEAYMEEHNNNKKYVTVGELIAEDYLESDATNPRTGESGFVGADMSQVIIKPDLSGGLSTPEDEGAGHYYINGYIFIKDFEKALNEESVVQHIPEGVGEVVVNTTQPTATTQQTESCEQYYEQMDTILAAAKKYMSDKDVDFIYVEDLKDENYYNGELPSDFHWSGSGFVYKDAGYTKKECEIKNGRYNYFYDGYVLVVIRK